MADDFGKITISGTPVSGGKKKKVVKKRPTVQRPLKPVQKKPVKTRPVRRQPVAPRKPKRVKKEIRWNRFFIYTSLLLSVLVILYAVVGFFLAPDLLRTSLTDKVRSSTGLEMNVGKISFNPFSFRTKLQDVSLKTPTNKSYDQTPPLLELDSFDVNLELTSLLRSRLVCSNLNIDGFKLVIVRDKKKKYSFARLNPDPRKKINSDMMEFSKLPFLFSFNNVVASRGQVIFDDQFTAKVHKAERVELQLPTLANFTARTKPTIEPRFSAIINGSPVELLGETTSSTSGDPTKSKTKLSFNIKSLDLPLYFGYLPSSLPLRLTKGSADGTLQLSFALNNNRDRRLTIDFDISSHKIALHSSDNSLLARAPKVIMKGSVQPFTGSLHLQELLIQKPTIGAKSNLTPKSFLSFFPFLKKSIGLRSSSYKKKDLLIDKLVVDNGTIQIANGKERTTWHSIIFQLDQYNKNGRVTGKGSSKGRFNLSGSKKKHRTKFSWKGTLDQANQMTGDINIQSLSPSTFFSLLGQTPTVTSGKCNIRGKLTLAQGKKNTDPFVYSLDDSTITMNKLGLSHDNSKWLYAPKIKLVSFSGSQNKFNLGNLFIENGDLSLKAKKLPPFLTLFSTSKQLSLHGIDYSGSLTYQSDKDVVPLKLSDLHVQANNLDNSAISEKNFGLTSRVGRKGELKAQGAFALKPLKGSIELSFSRLPLSLFSDFYSGKQIIFNSPPNINGHGTLSFPSWTYSGSLGANKGSFSLKESSMSIDWSKVKINKFLITREPFQIELADISSSNLEVTEDGNRWLSAKSLRTDRISKDNASVLLGNIQVKNGKIILIENSFPKILSSWFTKKEAASQLKSLNYTGSLTIQPEKQNQSLLKLTSIRFKADDLDRGKKNSDNLSFSASFNDTGSFRFKGDLNFMPLRTSLGGDFSSIHSKYIFPWLTDAKILLESQALLSGKGRVLYPQKSYTGFLQVADARIRKNQDELLFGWRTADFSKMNIELDPLKINSSLARITEPGFGWLRIGNDKDALKQAADFFKMLFSYESQKKTNGDNNQQLIDLQVGKIILRNGSAQHVDKRLQPPWQTDISKITGSLKTIDTKNPETQTSVNLSASLSGSPITVIGSAWLAAKKTRGDILLKMTTVPLSLFSRQIKPQVQLDPSAGTFDLVMNSKYFNGKKSGSAHFTFSSLSPTSSSADTAIPLALLSNHKSISQLYVPLDNNGPHPERSLFSESINLFQTKVIKAKISPLLLAGQEFSDLVNNHSVLCKAGKKTITPNGRNLMGRYTDLAKNHPNLVLTIIGSADPVKDNTHLKKGLMEKELLRVKEENIKRAAKRKKWEENKKKQLTRKKQPKKGFTETNIPLNKPRNLAPALPQPVFVSDKMLKELAISRAHEVYNQFVAVNNLDPEQLLLSEEVQISRNQKPTGTRVIIQLSARP